jgi:hypothetical protein
MAQAHGWRRRQDLDTQLRRLARRRVAAAPGAWARRPARSSPGGSARRHRAFSARAREPGDRATRESAGCRRRKPKLVGGATAAVIWSSDAVANPSSGTSTGKARSDGCDTLGASQDLDQLPGEPKRADRRTKGEPAGQIPCAPRARFERVAYCLGGTSGTSPGNAG